MNLYCRCKKCGEFIYFKSRIRDRFQLAKQKGKNVELKCICCQSKISYHVNDITAEKGRMMSLLAMVILIVGTVGLLYIVLSFVTDIADIYAISGLIGTAIIPYYIYEAIHMSEDEKVRYFNGKRYG